MDNIKRIPRPMGVTALMAEYHKTNDPELLDKIKVVVSQNWMLNGGILFGNQLSIHELAFCIGSRVSDIHTYMANQMLTSSVWQTDSKEEIIQQLIGTSIGWSLEDRIVIDQQINLLLKSQRGEYKPFITSEVNKALSLKISSNNTLQSLLKGLTSSNTVNIFNQTNNHNDSNSISQEDAVILIQKQLAMNNHDTIEYIESSGQLDDLPEIIATKQQGIDISKEGLHISKTEINNIIDDYKGAISESDNTHHEMRREIEEGIIIDEDDPETELY